MLVVDKLANHCWHCAVWRWCVCLSKQEDGSTSHTQVAEIDLNKPGTCPTRKAGRLLVGSVRPFPPAPHVPLSGVEIRESCAATL